MKVYGINKNKTHDELKAEISYSENTVSVTLKKDLIQGTGYDSIQVKSPLTSVEADGQGYLFFPTHCCGGVVKCNLTKRADSEFKTDIASMPVCGICERESAVFVLVKGGAADARFSVSVKNNLYEIIPEFILDGDDIDEDICVTYYKLPFASYSDMARTYRKYLLEEKGCRPLKERVKENPHLKYACEALEFRVRMGWKPVPTPVMHQTPENEPPLKVVCDFKKLRKIIAEMRRQGIKKSEICLVGWSEGGHDGRFPQNYPCDSRYGTDKELIEVIKFAKEMGYQIVCHTNSVCAFEIANNWDKSALTHKKDENGSIIPMTRDGYVNSGGLSGGAPYHLCAKTSYEKYASVDLPRIREYGFAGLHFVDELTACVPEKCYHKEHPVTRKQAIENYKKIAMLSKKLFGGFQSEGWFDFMNDEVDFIMYTAFCNEVNNEFHPPLADELIPFWQLVYHGIVLSNPNSHTVNYTLKGSDEHMRFIEYGGRPLMYLHSKFGEKKNWMGDIDLTCDNDDAIKACVSELKKAEDEFECLKYLQYEFMDNHEKLKDGVFCTTYSDGTKITVDYNTGAYDVEMPKNK